MASIAGRINQHIGCGCCYRAIKNGFQRLVTRLPLFKAQVITKNDEFFGPTGNHINDVGEVHHVLLVHFNEAQAVWSIGLQTSFDQRRFSCATRTCEQHIVCRQAIDKLQSIALNFFFLNVNFFQVIQGQGGHMFDGFENAVPIAAFAVAKSNTGSPIRRMKCLGKYRFDTGHQGFGSEQHAL